MKEPAEEKKQSSVEKRASDTAMFAAIHRFISSLEEHPHFKGPDHLAKLFVPSKDKFFLSFSFIRHHVCKKLNKVVPGTHEYMMARTKHFDDLFRQALADNIPQIVFLGAGYDTRAIRFKDSVRQTKIFELDVPTTQQQKKELLLKAGISKPEQLSFVPINFNKESMQNVLSNAGYDKSQKSFFIWEGVTYYLPAETVKNTLGIIKNYSGAGSTVAFDYFYKSIVQGKSRVSLFSLGLNKEKSNHFWRKTALICCPTILRKNLKKLIYSLIMGNSSGRCTVLLVMFMPE
jgi:methyltransferase (TIGR00027 family)